MNHHPLHRAAGYRVIAQVLAALPWFGLEAVTLTEELTPGLGRSSAAHVLNLLARLHDGAPLNRMETVLTVATTPLAETAHHDCLRREQAHA